MSHLIKSNSKRCSRCGVEKNISEFGNHKQGKDGLRSRCKPCNAIEAKNTYARNPTPYKRRARIFKKESAATQRDWLRLIKEHRGCACCGEKTVCVLEFHHLRDKDRPVTSMIAKGIDMLEAELAKCVVLCANCHKKVHAGLMEAPESALCNERFPRSPNRRLRSGGGNALHSADLTQASKAMGMHEVFFEEEVTQ